MAFSPTLDDIFHESYDSESDKSEEDLLEEEMSGLGFVGANEENMELEEEFENDEFAEDVMDKKKVNDNLGISEDLARKNYLAAGTEVEEEKDRITITGNKEHMNSEVNDILNRIFLDLDLPYNMSDFQRVAVNCLGMQKSVVLVSPTGMDRASTCKRRRGKYFGFS